MGGGGGLRGDKAGLLGGGGGGGGARGSGGGELALATAGGRNPRALHVCRALEPPALAASPAAAVTAIFLSLVAAVLTRGRANAGRGADNYAGFQHRDWLPKVIIEGRVRVRVGFIVCWKRVTVVVIRCRLRLGRLPDVDPAA